MLQQSLINPDLSKKRVMVSISGGINSAAVLCYLATDYFPREYVPDDVFIFYSHLREHSPDTFQFAKALIRYAQAKFNCVTWEISRGSVIKFFDKRNMIPHPMLSPCSEHLKAIPAMEFIEKHKIDIDLVGFVKTERRRIFRQIKKGVENKSYPIAHLTDEDCFSLVKREIGWYPAIYDIRDEEGNRVFKHNNCLPCKNMEGRLEGFRSTGEYALVEKYYPEYFAKAAQLSERVESHWGRDQSFDGYCRTCED